VALTFLSYATLFTTMTSPEHKLAQGELELCLLPLIGGRLMDVRYKGSSLLFQNPDLVGRVPDLERLSELEWHGPAVTLHAEQSHAFILNYFLVPESRSTSAREMFTRIEEHYRFVP